MMTTLHSEFITTARAKGLSETAVLLEHAFRIARCCRCYRIPGRCWLDLLTGSFVVENLSVIPGIGVLHGE